jgi:hypothetical protein
MPNFAASVATPPILSARCTCRYPVAENLRSLETVKLTGQTYCVFALSRGFKWGRTGGGYQQNFIAIIWQGSCLYRFSFFPEVIYCQIAGDRE